MKPTGIPCDPTTSYVFGVEDRNPGMVAFLEHDVGHRNHLVPVWVGVRHVLDAHPAVASAFDRGLECNVNRSRESNGGASRERQPMPSAWE